MHLFQGNTVVWQYERNQRDGAVREHSSETLKFGKVVGLAWLRSNKPESEFTLLSAHVDGIIVSWKVMATKTVHNKM